MQYVYPNLFLFEDDFYPDSELQDFFCSFGGFLFPFLSSQTRRFNLTAGLSSFDKATPYLVSTPSSALYLRWCVRVPCSTLTKLVCGPDMFSACLCSRNQGDKTGRGRIVEIMNRRRLQCNLLQEAEDQKFLALVRKSTFNVSESRSNLSGHPRWSCQHINTQNHGRDGLSSDAAQWPGCSDLEQTPPRSFDTEDKSALKGVRVGMGVKNEFQFRIDYNSLKETVSAFVC